MRLINLGLFLFIQYSQYSFVSQTPTMADPEEEYNVRERHRSTIWRREKRLRVEDRNEDVAGGAPRGADRQGVELVAEEVAAGIGDHQNVEVLEDEAAGGGDPQVVGINMPEGVVEDIINDEAEDVIIHPDLPDPEDENAHVLGVNMPEEVFINDEDEDFIIHPDLPDPEDENADEEIDSSEEDSDEEDVADEDDPNVINIPANQRNFNFNHEGLAVPLAFNVQRNVKDSLLMDLALSVRHNWTYEALMQVLLSKNTLFGERVFPQLKPELWEILGRNDSGVKIHKACRCGNYLGKKNSLEAIVNCGACHSENIDVSKLEDIYELDLGNQFHHFLSTRGIPRLLNYKNTRRKRGVNTMEDVYDSKKYKDLEENFLEEHDLTAVLNADGCKISKGAKTSIFPFFVRVNELPPNLRQKFMFLEGLWVGEGEPPIMAFLTPIVEQLNRLSNEGIEWQKPDGQVVRTRVYPMCFCVDGKARWQMLNMSPCNTVNGCTSCLIDAEYLSGSMRYSVAAPSQDRTDANMKMDMLEAHRNLQQNPNAEPVRGHKGLTPLMLLKTLDLAKGQAFDDLHNIYLCITMVLTNLIIDVVPKLNGISEETFLKTLDVRMAKIKTPSKIARKPKPKTFEKRYKMRGNELRNWLIYYAVPCLKGLIADEYINVVALISHATFLLSLDCITPEQITLAESYINQFLELFEEKFGVERTRLNIHSSRHAGASTRENGNWYCYSTFNFESWNHRLMKMVKSVKGAVKQIINRHLIHMHLSTAVHSEDIADDIRQELSNILGKKRLVHSRQVKDGVYVLGEPDSQKPTAEQSRILELEGFATNDLCLHKKILISGVKYVVENSVKPQQKSNNSMIYTYENTFCTIKDVVTFVNEGNNERKEVCGLFVAEHSINRQPFRYAHHNASLGPRERDIMHFIEVDVVRAPVVILPILDKMYVVNMPNTFEID